MTTTNRNLFTSRYPKNNLPYFVGWDRAKFRRLFLLVVYWVDAQSLRIVAGGAPVLVDDDGVRTCCLHFN